MPGCTGRAPKCWWGAGGAMETSLCHSLTGHRREFAVHNEDFTPDSLTWKRWGSAKSLAAGFRAWTISVSTGAEPAALRGHAPTDRNAIPSCLCQLEMNSAQLSSHAVHPLSPCPKPFPGPAAVFQRAMETLPISACVCRTPGYPFPVPPSPHLAALGTHHCQVVPQSCKLRETRASSMVQSLQIAPCQRAREHLLQLLLGQGAEFVAKTDPLPALLGNFPAAGWSINPPLLAIPNFSLKGPYSSFLWIPHFFLMHQTVTLSLPGIYYNRGFTSNFGLIHRSEGLKTWQVLLQCAVGAVLPSSVVAGCSVSTPK